MEKTANYVKFDVSELPVGHEEEGVRKIYGFGEQRLEPRELTPLSFKGSVRNIEGYGKIFGELFREGIEGEPSLTLGEEAALFNVYLLARRGVVNDLTEDQMSYLNHKFNRIGYGNILQTIVDFDNGNKSPAKEGYKRVLLINRPELLVVEDGIIKEVIGGEAKPKLWPANGYVERTCDGIYDSDGVPIKTNPTRKGAEATWPQITEEEKAFAKDAVSYSWSREEGQGKVVLSRRFFDRDVGRFDLSAVGDPWSRGGRVGRSPVSR